jgi:hypothetical protein
VRDEVPEYFPPLEELVEKRRQRAVALVTRLQTLGRASQEFCTKMAMLDEAPSEFPYGGSTIQGYVIPLTRVDECGQTVETHCFIGCDGYFADYDDNGIGRPNDAILRADASADQMVDSYMKAMLDAIVGDSHVVRPSSFGGDE